VKGREKEKERERARDYCDKTAEIIKNNKQIKK
jgi:hypothetical protein